MNKGGTAYYTPFAGIALAEGFFVARKETKRTRNKNKSREATTAAKQTVFMSERGRKPSAVIKKEELYEQRTGKDLRSSRH